MPLGRRVEQPWRVREEEAATMEERKRGGLKGAEEAATKQYAHLNTYSSATPWCVPPPVPFFLSRPPLTTLIVQLSHPPPLLQVQSRGLRMGSERAPAAAKKEGAAAAAKN